MINLDLIAENFKKYAVTVSDIEQAKMLFDAVKERWPEMTKNWGSVRFEEYIWNERCFLFHWADRTALFHGRTSQHKRYYTMIPFEYLMIPELPEFDAGDFSISSLLGV